MTSDQRIRKLKIIHFNDCYNIEEQIESGSLRGGAARFVNALQSEITENTVVLFSGDILSPSISKFDLLIYPGLSIHIDWIE